MKITKQEKLNLLIESVEKNLSYLRDEDCEESEDYKKLEKIRNDLIKQWEKTLNKN